MASRLREALVRTQQYFFRTQSEDGYWWGELESNPTMEAEYIMLTQFLGSDEGDRIPRIAEDIRRRQSADGSWRMYYGAPGDLSTSIECYFALKLAGDSQDDPHMAKAREFILKRGGVPKARVFTKIWLALFGQWDWKGTPAMPPDMLLLPKWAPFNIYRFASWARATIVPMTIILTLHPIRPPEERAWVLELYPEGPVTFTMSRWKAKPFSLKGGFLVLDKAIRLYRSIPFIPGRKRAVKAAEEWIVSHQEADGSWAGIQPPWVYSLIALSALGYSLDHPVIAKGLEGFRRNWSVPSKDGDALRVQACLSPVWDTCLAMRGLLDSGVSPHHPAMQRAAAWLVGEEIRVNGDWAVYRPNLEPSGWAFEFENVHYPDIDDSAIIVTDLDLGRVDRRQRRQRGAGAKSGNRARGRLADGDAVLERRMGRVRLEQRLPAPGEDSIRRLWRTARPSERGRYRARTGDVREAGVLEGNIQPFSGGCPSCGNSRSTTVPGSDAGA